MPITPSKVNYDNLFKPLSPPSDGDVVVKPSMVTASGYRNALTKKSWFESAVFAPATVITGVEKGLTKYPQLLGNTIRYASGSLATLTGKSDEMTAVLGEFSNNSIIRKRQVKQLDEPGFLLDFLVKSDQFGREIVNDNRQWMSDTFGEPVNTIDKLAEGYGQGLVSMAEAVGIGSTIGPVGVFGYFALSEAGDKYAELVDAGIPIDKSFLGSSIDGLLNGGVEAISTVITLGTVNPNWLVRGLKVGVTEGIEEILQQGVSDVTSLSLGVNPLTGERGDKTDFLKLASNYIMVGTIGALVGSTTGISLSRKMRNNLRDLYRANGLSEEASLSRANEAIRTASDDALVDMQKQLKKSLSEKQKLVMKAYNMEELTDNEKSELEQYYIDIVGSQVQIDEEINIGEEIVRLQGDKIEKATGRKIRPKVEIQDEAVDKMLDEVYKGRESRLNDEINQLDKEIINIEKDISFRQKEGKPVQALSEKLSKKWFKWESLNAQFADIRDSALSELKKEKITITPRVIDKINKLSYTGIKSRIIDYAGKKIAPEQFKQISRDIAKANTMEDVEAAIGKIDILANKFIKSKAEKVILKTRKNPEQSIDVQYQNQIDKIQNKLGKTKTERKKSLKDMSVEETVSLAREISRLTEEGRTLLKSKKEQRSLAASIMEESLLNGIGQKSTPKIGSQKRGRIDYNVMRPSRMFRVIFGEKAGNMLDISIDYADTEKMYNITDRKGKVVESFKKNKLNKATFGKSIEVEGLRLTVNQAMRLAVAESDSQSKEAIIGSYKNEGMTEDRYKQIINKLKNEYPGYYQFAKDVQEIVSGRYQQVLDVMERIHNVTMKKVANYFPINRIYDDGNIPDTSNNMMQSAALELIARQEKPDYESINKGFTIERKEIDSEKQRKVSLDFLGDAMKAIDAQEHLISYSSLQKLYNKVISDGRLKQAILDNKGTRAWTEFSKHMSAVIEQRVSHMSNDWFSVYAGKLRKAFSSAYIGGNLVTATKQLPSTFLALKYTSLPQLASSIVKVVTNPKVREAAMIRDPRLKLRSVSRDLNELLQSRPDLIENDIIRQLVSATHSISEKTYGLLISMDKLAVAAVHDAVYTSALKTMSEQEALDLAARAVRETQPQGGIKDLPNFYKTDNELLRLAIMFTNQLNQIYNMLAVDVGVDFKNREYRKIIDGIASVMISSFLIYLASGGGTFPEDEDEMAGALFDALFGSAVSSIPVFGNIAMSSFRGFNPSLNPIDSVINSIRRIPKTFENNKIEGTLDAVANLSILSGLGFPAYSQLKRTISGAVDLFSGETEDLRRLIFSSYQLKED